MRQFIFKIISLLSFILLLNACGDLGKKKVVKKELDSKQFQLGCEIDVNRLSKILEENIADQIQCLQANLDLFIRVVEQPRAGHLSRVEFEIFVRRNRKEISEDTIKALKAVFQLNHLITGEDPDYISQGNIKKLVDLALVFNSEAALNFGPFFQSTIPASYELHINHRERVKNASKKIMVYLLKVFNSNREANAHKLNIEDLMESFTTDGTREDIEKVKKVLFAKRIIVGGNEHILSNSEVEQLILNFDKYILMAFDMKRYEYITPMTQESLFDLLKMDVDNLYKIVFQDKPYNRDEEVMFKMDEAFTAINTFVSKDDFDLEKYKNLIVEIKKIAVGGDRDIFKGIELKRAFEHGRNVLDTGNVFHRMYRKYKEQLDTPRPVNIDFSEDRHTYPEYQDELIQFERIVKKYRYFRGVFHSPYYTLPFRRNADGVVEIAIFEYIMKIAMKEFGSPSNGLNGFSVNLDQVQAVFKKFEKDLVKLDLLLPGMGQITANNIALLGILFQNQADNNTVLDVNEGTEFAVSLVSAIDMSKEMLEFYEKKGCYFDQYKRVEPDCFKRHFFQGFCKNYRQYYPRLFEAYNAPARCEDIENTGALAALLDRSIFAGRVCNNYTDGDKEEIYYSEGDILAVIVVLIHLETTINRWDKNNNNFLDPNEVDDAYSIFSTALDGFLANKPGIIKKFKKQIYQYMAKYEEVPDEKKFSSIWRFIKFIISFDKRVTANRKTLASILYQISLQNQLLPGYEGFNCNYLRDPTKIPSKKDRQQVIEDKASGVDYSTMLEPYSNLVNP